MRADRRRFLTRVAGRRPHGPRPPWAIAEGAFIAVCTRCGDCVRECGERILVSGSGGFPEVDFSRGECTFCGQCADVCTSGAMGHPRTQAPWSLKASVGEACLAKAGIVCGTCGDACDSRALRFTPRPGGVAVPMVDAEACTGCGACVAPCPAGAIRVAEPRYTTEGTVA